MNVLHFLLSLFLTGNYPFIPPVFSDPAAIQTNAFATHNGQVIYFNDFNDPPGSRYPEWSSPGYSYDGAGVSGVGPQQVTNARSPNGRQTFLGEFGGPSVVPQGGKPVIRVDESVLFTLGHLAPHKNLTIAFDLYILKSWDGDSPQYGPDRFRLKVGAGPLLMDHSFSNNPKVTIDGSLQDYPSPGSQPQSGAFSVGTLGYNNFFKDAIYHLEFSFAHSADSLQLDFSSSLFEGKGTPDESWGLDNVRVSAAP
jgi:hypothetical protein